jgi:hypothetical protein
MLNNSLKKNISKKINTLEPTFANIVYSQKMLIMLYGCNQLGNYIGKELIK